VEQLEGRDVPSVSQVRPTFVLLHVRPAGVPAGVGFTPDQVRTAYGINSITFSGGTITGDGTGQTIAIVDAFNDPNIVGDLNAFDQNVYLSASDQSSNKTLYNRYGAASSFFTVYDQNGNVINPSNTSVPAAGNSGWAIEESLDVEWAHSIAPGAKIDLVECSSDLYTGTVKGAGLSGVSAVSMSWGSSEFSGETSFDNDFVHHGVTFLAATGDSGAPGGYPAYSPNVVATGGTSLFLNASNTWQSETGWAGSGGGTSAVEGEPSYQTGAQTTGARTIPDVALVADPNTGVAVYDSYDFGAGTPWAGIGGTSVACPCWAGLIAVTNQGRVAVGSGVLNATSATQTQTILYGLPSSDFHDNLGGDNGSSTTGLKNPALYNEITGLGSPVANLLVPDVVAGGSSRPTVLSVTPSAGPTAGGTQVSISGTNLGTASTVTVDFGVNNPATVVSDNGSTLVVNSPAGSGTVDVVVTTSKGTSTTSPADQFTYDVAPTVSGVSPSTGANGGNTTVTITGSGFTPATQVDFGSNPAANFVVNSDTQIAAVSPVGAVGTVDITVTSPGGTSVKAKVDQFTYFAALTVSPSSLSAATARQNYSVTFTAAGGSGGYSFSVASGSLAPGLTLANGGLLSGTPTTAGSYTFTIQASDTNQAGLKGTAQYTLTVNAATALSISPPALPIATAKSSYGPITFSAAGGYGSYTFSLYSGKLPAGLTLSSSGVLSGTPTVAGTFTFLINATDNTQPSLTGTQQYTITVNKAIIISPASLPVATVNDAFSKTLTATGGSGTGYTFALASGSSLPAGLTLSSAGLISGTPTASGKFTFTVVATDTNGATGTKTYTLTIDPALTISPTTLPAAKIGQAYSEQFTASGGSGTGYTFKATGLPTWLKLSGTGLLSGTPPSNAHSSITFTVTVTDSNKGTLSEQYTLTVNP
jgi:hypothetical protein